MNEKGRELSGAMFCTLCFIGCSLSNLSGLTKFIIQMILASIICVIIYRIVTGLLVCLENVRISLRQSEERERTHRDTQLSRDEFRNYIGQLATQYIREIGRAHF